MSSKRSEKMNDMIAEVVNVRRLVQKEYEIKLKKFYAQRAKHMQHGIFNGQKLPEIRPNIGNLKRILQENNVLTEKAEFSAQQYLYAKSHYEHINEDLKDRVDTLIKVA